MVFVSWCWMREWNWDGTLESRSSLVSSLSHKHRITSASLFNQFMINQNMKHSSQFTVKTKLQFLAFACKASNISNKENLNFNWYSTLCLSRCVSSFMLWEMPEMQWKENKWHWSSIWSILTRLMLISAISSYHKLHLCPLSQYLNILRINFYIQNFSKHKLTLKTSDLNK